jgi:fibronectin type 3 domain-containing protein
MVYRATSVYGPYDPVGDASSTKYQDTNVLAGTTYYYKVIAANDAGESSYSNYAYATASSSSGGGNGGNTGGTTAAPSAPTGVSASAYTGYIEVTWNSVANVSYYTVYRATSLSGYYETVGYAEASKYKDTDVSTGTYYYKVIATNNVGETSDYSDPASATVSEYYPGGGYDY